MSINRSVLPTQAHEAIKNGQQHNNQDWICIKCNNLNFSFRKKCNRCKNQSREDNRQYTYVDYYYQQYYPYSIQSYNQSLPTPEINYFEPSKSFKTPEKAVQHDTIAQFKQIENTLPSVSPLIKKYNSSKEKARHNNKEMRNKSENVWKLFGDQIWNTVQFNYIDLVACQKQNMSNDDEEMSKQFTKSVEKMIV